MRYRTVLCAALLACGVTSSSSSDAQPTQAEIEASKKVAADAANKAFDAFRDGKYEDAIAGFQKADKAFHALKFVLYIARAQAKLGKLVAARTTYEAIVKEQLQTYAPPEFFTAQADAKKTATSAPQRPPPPRPERAAPSWAACRPRRRSPTASAPPGSSLERFSAG